MNFFGLKRKSAKKDESKNTESSQQQEMLQKILNEEKLVMLQGVEDLSKTSVKEVMVPRIDVDFIASNTPKEELFQKIIESGHSRFPVYTDSIDNVTGVLYVKDLLKKMAGNDGLLGDAQINLQKIIRKPYFVPESKRIDSLLREFKKQHLHIAIVIDEYGGISGIVTMEDIIEEIVGDIQDEFDKDQEAVMQISDNVWLCDARVNLDDLNETIGANFPVKDFDSLGGFVFDMFGEVPVKFEKSTWNNYEFIVHDMEGHRINMVKIIRKTEDGKPEDDRE